MSTKSQAAKRVGVTSSSYKSRKKRSNKSKKANKAPKQSQAEQKMEMKSDFQPVSPRGAKQNRRGGKGGKVVKEGKRGGSNANANKTRRRKRNYKNYKTFIFRIFKTVLPNKGISKIAMENLESITKEILTNVCHEANQLALKDNKRTITLRSMVYACRLLFGKNVTSVLERNYLDNEGDLIYPKKFLFPVSRFRRELRKYKIRVSVAAVIYGATAMEFVLAEIFDTISTLLPPKRVRVTGRTILQTIHDQEDWYNLLRKGVVSGAGHANLLYQEDNFRRIGGNPRAPRNSKKGSSKKTSVKKSKQQQS
jgi:histone H3/H4